MSKVIVMFGVFGQCQRRKGTGRAVSSALAEEVFVAIAHQAFHRAHLSSSSFIIELCAPVESRTYPRPLLEGAMEGAGILETGLQRHIVDRQFFAPQ